MKSSGGWRVRNFTVQMDGLPRDFVIGRKRNLTSAGADSHCGCVVAHAQTVNDVAEEGCKGWPCVNIAWSIAVSFVDISQWKPTSSSVKSVVNKSRSVGDKDVPAGIATSAWRCEGRV